MVEENMTKGKWNHFVLGQGGSFLQSYEWGEFQKKFGRRVFRLAGDDWQAQFIEMPLPFGKKYWYCPRGPIMANSQWPIANSENKSTSLPADAKALAGKQPSPYQGEGAGEVLQGFIDEIREMAKKEGVMFFRICPEWPADMELEAKLEIPGFKKLRYDIEPAQTLILDIAKSEEDLLTQMHPKWRYNIGLAQKKGVRVKMIGADDPDFEKYFSDFWRLMEQTAKRQKIRLHDEEYYRKQLNPPPPSFKKEGGSSLYKREVGRDFANLLFIVEHQDQVIAANIVNFFGRRAFYLHGGSDNEKRSLMVPHLLQWEQIREAKKRGCSEYDFWGINEQKWPGVTRFKKGFGGHEVNYIGCWDYPLDKKWYLLYRGVQKFRR